MKAIYVWLMTLIFWGSCLSCAAGPYTDSAHGDSSIGVLRNSLSTPPKDYAKGNCAHCHEQHSSVVGSEPAPYSPAGPDVFLLFSDNYIDQTTCFCFDCHKGVGPHQNPPFNNYNYSYKAGRDTSIMCPDDILEAFSFINESGGSISNCGSMYGTSHKLTDIRTFIAGRNWGYTAKSNPCTACHNPHRAQRDSHTPGNRGWPVSLPSEHGNSSPWDLFGDEPTERMSKYTYQAPKAQTGFEPDGSATQDGSNLTDYVGFCTDCHNSSYTIYSNVLRRNLYYINWNMEKHGGRSAGDCCVNILSPYQQGLCGSYVLACTDCHEPHGAPNIFLTREKVNNGDVTVLTGTGPGPGPGTPEECEKNKEWINLCKKCHDFGPHIHPATVPPDPVPPDPPGSCSSWACHYSMHEDCAYRPCGDCHYHGSNSIDGVPYGEPLF